MDKLTNHADVIFDALSSHALVDDEFQGFFDGPSDGWMEKIENGGLTFSHCGYDHYDSSIEIYLKDTAEFDKEKLREMLNRLGFNYGWINFSDGTEIHFNSSSFGERKSNGRAVTIPSNKSLFSI